MIRSKRSLGLAAALVITTIYLPELAHAYVGPGAGFAFLGSGFVFILTILLGFATIAFWPLQWAWRLLRGKGIPKNARTRRVVIMGLDGLEPKLTERYMSEGAMPNLQRLAEQGTFSRLGTTLPALSPVAWSTFQTGVNPGAHNIFDFLTRDKRYCLPLLSSTEIDPPRTFGFGRWRIKLGGSRMRIMRKSKPFWHILGEHGIFSTVLRVPISFPAEPFDGNILSAMCTPDLRGTQGSFTFFTTKDHAKALDGGEFQRVRIECGVISAELIGPPHPKDAKRPALRVPFTVQPSVERGEAELSISGVTYTLKLNQFSDWIEVKFRFGWRGVVSGICRFCLRELSPDFSLYVSPINVNPEKPALPISHPITFATWLAKRHGLFGTLGLMEDTWGRNELALDDRRFLDQTYLTHSERERMFFEALDKTREGLCACVFDASDRIQHMFWRYIDPQHKSPCEDISEFADVIPDMYRRMDDLVGRAMQKIGPKDALIVLSDHGFASFRRGINLNSWLYQNGYLALKDGAQFGTDYFKDVDWSRTRAFAVGLSGFYLNRRGREHQGILSEEEFVALKIELAQKLEALRDPLDGEVVIRKVYDTTRAYRGVYTEDAPDMIVGYAPGYRVSWESVTGGLEQEVFSDNIKAWSGDHHVDPKAVPGVLFSNLKLRGENPHIIDMAPTVLDLFAVAAPKYMEGRVVL